MRSNSITDSLKVFSQNSIDSAEMRRKKVEAFLSHQDVLEYNSDDESTPVHPLNIHDTQISKFSLAPSVKVLRTTIKKVQGAIGDIKNVPQRFQDRAKTLSLSSAKHIRMSTKGTKKESVVEKYTHTTKSKGEASANGSANGNGSANATTTGHLSLKKIKEEVDVIVRHRSFADLSSIQDELLKYGIVKPTSALTTRHDVSHLQTGGGGGGGVIRSRRRRLSFPSTDCDEWVQLNSASHIV